MSPANPRVSVILCTRNPRPDLIRWALESIQHQTLPSSDYELVIVDNGSTPPLEETALGATGGAALRILREPRPGLTRARIAGIAATAAPLIVFVDDDNYLDADYLEQALEIAAEFPFIGCFGGKTRAVFEDHVPAWKHHLLGYLGVRDYGPHAITSNQRCWGKWEPIGAGLVCRRDVAEAFVRWVDEMPQAIRLGHTGAGLMAGEDTLLAQSAYRVRYSCSYQPTLKLSHWMKASRLRPLVLARTLAGHGRSAVLLQTLKGEPVYRPRTWFTVSELSRRFFRRVRHDGLGAGTIEWFWDLGWFREARRLGQ